AVRPDAVDAGAVVPAPVAGERAPAPAGVRVGLLPEAPRAGGLLDPLAVRPQRGIDLPAGAERVGARPERLARVGDPGAPLPLAADAGVARHALVLVRSAEAVLLDVEPRVGLAAAEDHPAGGVGHLHLVAQAPARVVPALPDREAVDDMHVLPGPVGG